MANYATLKAAIQNVIRTNGNNEITGSLLQQTLLTMVTSLGADYLFVGIANTGTTPGTPDQNVFYIAGPGTYPNFGNATIADGRIGVFKYNGSWATESVPVGKDYSNELAELADEISGVSGTSDLRDLSGITREIQLDVFPKWVHVGKLLANHYYEFEATVGSAITGSTLYVQLYDGKGSTGIGVTLSASITVGNTHAIARGYCPNDIDGWLYISTTATQRPSAITVKLTDIGLVNLNDVAQKLQDGTGIVAPQWVIGNISISSSGWVYANANNRVCLKRGTTLHFRPGDKIGLTSYTNTRYYVGWKRANGTYGANGWRTSDFDITDEGDYIILIANNPDTTQTTPDTLANLFFANTKINNVRLDERLNALEGGNVPFETLLGTLTTVGAGDTYINVNIPAGSAIKIVIDSANATRFGIGYNSATSNIFPVRTLKSGDTRFFFNTVQLTRLTLYCAADVTATASFYLVNKPDMAYRNPELFTDNPIQRFGFKGVQQMEWSKDRVWVIGTDEYGISRVVTEVNSKRFGSQIIYAQNAHVKISLTDTTNYRFYIYPIITLDEMTGRNSGWLTSYNERCYGQAFVVVFDKNNNAIDETDIVASGIKVEIMEDYAMPNVSYNEFESLRKTVSTISPTTIASNTKKADNALIQKFIVGKTHFYGHFFIESIYGNGPRIPSESLFDVDAAARLGVPYIEANVHATSDGVLIPIHGVSGTFGREVTDLNGGFTYENTRIDSVTYAWIAANLRYDSYFAKHRTTIPTLEQFIMECKAHGISVMMSYTTASYALAKKYFDDNFIAYNGNRNAGFTGIIMQYSGLTTKAEILAQCDSIKPPYLHMLNPDAFAVFNNAGTLADLAQAVHEKGCMLGLAGCYQTVLENIAFFEAGGDMSASNNFVNDFPVGNLCNLNGDENFNDFTITGGTQSNGVLSMPVGATITAPTMPEVYLGKGFLRIRFNGKLRINTFGHYKFTNVVLESDGTKTKWISTYFLAQSPNFVLEATEATEIYMLNYKASKV